MRRCLPARMACPPSAHPLVRRLYEEMRRQKMGVTDLAERTGVHRKTICRWRRDRSPNLVNVEACLNAFGLELAVRQKR